MNGFLWGASTSAHQVEGNNTNSDWWQLERLGGSAIERSGDGIDSYHRYPEDMRLLADAGLNAYRFSIEWARIEPDEGHISLAALAHYRRMIDTAIDLGLTPVVTLHHFTNPSWFIAGGGWLAPHAVDRFRRYVEAATSILYDVRWVITINEPNVFALMSAARNAMTNAATNGAGDAAISGEDISRLLATVTPDPTYGDAFATAHRAARAIVKERTDAAVGWSIANQAFRPAPGGEAEHARIQELWEDRYLRVSRDDDFVGVQSYTSQLVTAEGIVPHAPDDTNTLTGWAYRPDSIGIALRNTARVTGGVPMLITENGIATNDDERRIAYTDEALHHVAAARTDGLDVRGYLHWSALDNFEWGHWAPTFGLICVDRATFERTPKPSLTWLGQQARRHPNGPGVSSQRL